MDLLRQFVAGRRGRHVGCEAGDCGRGGGLGQHAGVNGLSVVAVTFQATPVPEGGGGRG